MMADKPSSRPSTLLDGPFEPLSDEDRRRLSEEWAKKTLDEISYLAIGNQDIGRALCETAVLHASLNDELSGLIKDKLKKNPGRPAKWSPEINKILLIHYAYEMLEPDASHESARKQVAKYNCRRSGILLDDKVMENKISMAIGDVREGKLSLCDLPDWAQPVILTRMDRGTLTRRRTKKSK